MNSMFSLEIRDATFRIVRATCLDSSMVGFLSMCDSISFRIRKFEGMFLRMIARILVSLQAKIRLPDVQTRLLVSVREQMESLESIRHEGLPGPDSV